MHFFFSFVCLSSKIFFIQYILIIYIPSLNFSQTLPTSKLHQLLVLSLKINNPPKWKSKQANSKLISLKCQNKTKVPPQNKAKWSNNRKKNHKIYYLKLTIWILAGNVMSITKLSYTCQQSFITSPRCISFKGFPTPWNMCSLIPISIILWH